MKYQVEVEQMYVNTTHFRIEVEVEAESVEEAMEAAFQKAGREDINHGRRRPRPGDWRKSHEHRLKSTEVVKVVSQSS